MSSIGRKFSVCVTLIFEFRVQFGNILGQVLSQQAYLMKAILSGLTPSLCKSFNTSAKEFSRRQNFVFNKSCGGIVKSSRMMSKVT